MEQKTYKLERMVDYAYTDFRGDARFSYLLAIAQQVSMEHCDSVGIGGHYFRERGMAFLLAKQRLDIVRLPHGGEHIHLLTSPNLPVRAQYRRRTQFTAADGSPLISMDARWVLVDIESRRLLRRLPQGVDMPFLDAEELEDFRPTPPQELTLCDEVTVRYSAVDINGHMNNTVYGDLVCNLLEQPLYAGQRLRTAEIFYHREALPGSCLKLWLGGEGTHWFVRGTVADSVCFEANLQLQAL